MKTFSHTFSAAETITLPGGAHLEIISAADTLDIAYFKNDMQLDEVATAVPAGYYFTMPAISELVEKEGRQYLVASQNNFDSCQITSATAQSVLIGITRGDGGARSTATNLVGGNIDTLKDNYVTGATSQLFQSHVTGSLHTFLTPAANTGGVIIKSIHGYIGGAAAMRIMHKSSAPSAWTDGQPLLWQHLFTSTYNYQTVSQSHIALPYLVPAGDGIYMQPSGSVDHAGDIGIIQL